MFRSIVGIFAAVALLQGGSSLAQDNVYNGKGSAPITRDTNAVRVQAEEAARFDLVRAIGRQLLGSERMSELTPTVVQQLASQIRDDMIVDRQYEKVGKVYEVTLTARVDRAWFMGLLDDQGIRANSINAGGQNQRILVLIDESIGPARDYSKPLQVTTEYDRSSGAAYSDQSSLSYSDQERAASSSSSASALSAKGSSAAGYSDGYGSVGAASSGKVDAAAKSKESSAYASSTVLQDKTDVRASRHDDVRFRQTVVYQPSASSRTGQAAMSAITEQLMRYDISTSNAVGAMAGFAPGKPLLFSDLQKRGELAGLFTYIRKNSDAPFLMGGTLAIQDNGPHPATNQPTCTGSLNAQAFATANGADIASTLVSGETSASSYELCASKLSGMLAQQAGERLGPQVQKFWRNQLRDQRGVVAAATAGPVDYTLTVRGSNLNMATQADFLDALAGIPGLESHVFLSETTGQFSLQVRYGGSTPLHLALYQRLRNNPAFAKMTSETAPRQVLICLNGCR